jgi:uncharacterized protein YbjT (DUF2867 family)
MSSILEKTRVLVFGATGSTGGAAARALLHQGWAVRAVTRSPSSPKAQSLARLGAQVIQADMDDPRSLEAAFDGIKQVFSVQNWITSGPGGEVRQGKSVAEAARRAGVHHLVYLSAGTGQPGTGLPHFESKLQVEAHMRSLELPFTILRPGPFMELMTKKDYFPALGIWGAAPKVLGWDTPSPWVAVEDIGRAAAAIFSHPQTWVGRQIDLFGDMQSLSGCREVFRAVTGKVPFRLPLPLALFRRMAGPELLLMWQWLREWVQDTPPDWFQEITAASRQLVPGMLDVDAWVKKQALSPSSLPARSGSRAS